MSPLITKAQEKFDFFISITASLKRHLHFVSVESQNGLQLTPSVCSQKGINSYTFI